LYLVEIFTTKVIKLKKTLSSCPALNRLIFPTCVFVFEYPSMGRVPIGI
jgi:hypothetical protein